MPGPSRGTMVFHSSCRAPLPPGDYALRVEQRLQAGTTRVDSGATKPLPAAQQQAFRVTGPRFTLDPGEVHAAYPPPNSSGLFSERLPMVVLRRRSLPWERTIDGAAANASAPTPWMALLLFEEPEVKLLDPPASTVAYVINGDAASNVVKLAPSPAPTAVELEQPCLGIELALSTFKQVAPMESELRYLTHVREVNTDDKELLGLDEDGWFAVVLGNRLPEAGKKYIACLVSLEGCRAYLPTVADAGVLTAGTLRRIRAAELRARRTARRERAAGASAAGTSAAGDEADEADEVVRGTVGGTRGPIVIGRPPISSTPIVSGANARIRLVTLARWTFACKTGGDFETLMRELPNRGGVAMFSAVTGGDRAAGGTAPAPVALSTGHVPLPYTTRSGEPVTALYRGPLTPTGVTRDLAGPYHTADQARRLDPDTGLENLGYAVAFEIGRLMALADPKFALVLLRWRRSGYRSLVFRVVQSQYERYLPSFLEKVRIPFIPPRLLDVLNVGIRQKGWLGPVRDLGGFDRVRTIMPGLNPRTVAAALRLDARVVSDFLGGKLDGDLRPGGPGLGTGPIGGGPIGGVIGGRPIGGVIGGVVGGGGRGPGVADSFDNLAGAGIGGLPHLGDVRGGLVPTAPVAPTRPLRPLRSRRGGE
ncbi:MAG TPA: hypothetical protein VNA89_00660 [Gemmatimonadaceae bacterium]|nr:hypothetical protein [Gemmatimonadaceae bacterium]